MNETDKGNKLIAEFMYVAYEYHVIEEVLYVQRGENVHMNGAKTPCLKIAKYHTSWDWLMPVMRELEKLYETESSLPGFSISGHAATFNAGGFKGHAASYPEGPKPAFNSRIEAAWYITVEFLKWWNTEKLLFDRNESTANQELVCCSCNTITKTLAPVCTVCVHQLQEELNGPSVAGEQILKTV